MRRAFLLLFLFVTVLTLSVGWGRASPHTSSMDLAEVETTPFVTFREVDHFGGAIHSVARRDDALYVGAGTHLMLVDVSSPNQLQVLGDPIDFAGNVTGIAASESYIYAALGRHGLAVLSQTGAAQIDVVTVMTGVWAFDVVMNANRLYVWQGGEVAILGLSDPENPQVLGTYGPLSGTGVAAADNHIYGEEGSDLVVIDATNAGAPSVVSRTPVGDVLDLSVASGHAYLVTTDEKLQIVNVTDPSSPLVAGSLALSSVATDVEVIGNHAYVSTNEVYAVDVSDPAQPVAAGRYNQLRAGELFAAGNDLLVTDRSRGRLHFLDLERDPAWPTQTGVLYQPSQAFDSVVHDEKLYLAMGYGGLQVVDLSDPYHMRPLAQFRSPTWTPVPGERYYIPAGTTRGVAVDAGYAFMANRRGGLHVADIHPLHDAEIAGFFSRPPSQGNTALDVVIRNGLAYVADGENGLLVLDVSNPRAPQELVTVDSTPAGSAEAAKVALVGSYLALVNRYEGLDLYSLANPGQPVLADRWEISTNALAVRDPYIFLGTADGLQILRITSNGQLQSAGSYDGMGVDDITVAGDDLYLTSFYEELRVLDISVPSSPVLRGTFAGVTGQVYTVDEPIVYVADHGLSALRRLTGVKGTIDGGGVLAVPQEGISYTFDAGVFPVPVEVRHTLLNARDLPLPPSTIPLYGPFDVEALAAEEPVSPVQSYTITIELDHSLSPAVASGLDLYAFDGEQWATTGGVDLHEDGRTVSATVAQAGPFLLTTRSSSRLFLPGVARDAAGVADLSITGIEVTQAIQDLDNGVPLTANRPTVARVYAEVTGADAVGGVTLTMRATRDGAQLPGAVTVGPRAVFPRVERDTPFTSFDVRLPQAWLQGTVKLTAEIDAQQQVGETNEQNNMRSATVAFRPLAPLRVVIVPVNYTSTASGAFCPAPEAEDVYSDGLQRLYPVHDVELSFRAPIDFSGDLATESARLLERVTAVKEADDAPAAVVYYGVFNTSNANGDFCRAGPAGLGWIGRRAAIGANNTAVNRIQRMDSSALLAAHEFGHNFGLLHVNCPVYTHDESEPGFPYPDGSIGEVGYDVLRGRIWSPGHPDYSKDIMSYCLKDWFSDYTYRRLFEDQQAHGQVNVAPPAPHLNVRATVGGETAELHPSYAITRTTAFPAHGVRDTAYAVELVDEAGAVLASQPAAVYRPAEGAGQRSIFASLPLPERPATTLRLLHEGQVIARRALAGQRPAQAAINPTLTTTDDGALLRWTRTQTPVLVRYTTDGGATWTTLAIDETGGELQLRDRQLPATPALFDVRPADTLALDAWTVPFTPAPQTGDE